YAIGLPYGPKGVAISYSIVMTFVTVPLLAWAIHNTPISLSEVFGSIARPLAAICIASILSYGASALWGGFLAVWPRLLIELTILFGIYGVFLAFIVGDKDLYLDVIRGLRRQAVTRRSATSA